MESRKWKSYKTLFVDGEDFEDKGIAFEEIGHKYRENRP